jgi:hypothetical protein
MSFSLYAAAIPSNIQILRAVAGLLDKAEAFCGERGIAADDIIQARLAADMFPFAYQVKSCAVHSLGAIDGVRVGTFSPDMIPPPADFAGLKAKVTGAIAALEAVDPAEIDGLIGKDMRFAFGGGGMDFTVENFLLSFSQPNFYFHATTTYDILRWKGVSLGKRDFIGNPRLKV